MTKERLSGMAKKIIKEPGKCVSWLQPFICNLLRLRYQCLTCSRPNARPYAKTTSYESNDQYEADTQNGCPTMLR